MQEVSEYVFRLRYQGTQSKEQQELARRASGLLPIEICRILHAGSQDAQNDMGRLVVFSAHDNTILALLAQLGFRDVPIPYFAAHVVFELHEYNGMPRPPCRPTHRLPRRRRRRRCGPLVGRIRAPTPWGPIGPHRSGPATDEGDPDRGPSPVQHHGGGSPLHLLPMGS